MTQHTPEKIAPVQGYTPGIPWSLHLEAYDAYRKKYGDQPALIDLEGRGCRGGFGTRELDDFIPGWRDKVSELARIKGQRDELLAALKSLMEMLDDEIKTSTDEQLAFGLSDPACPEHIKSELKCVIAARAAIAKAGGDA